MTLPAVVRLRNYRHYEPLAATGPGLIWLDMKAPAGKVFVAVVLGTENKDGTDPLPLIDFLRDLVLDGVAVVPDAAAATLGEVTS